MNSIVPAYRFRAPVRKTINHYRYTVDLYGLTLFKVLGPIFALVPWMHWIIAIYPTLATITILTIDPTRFPEAATTRINQRKAWIATASRAPFLAIVLAVVALGMRVPVKFHGGMGGGTIGLVVGVYLSELFWRNIFQPAIRKAGLSRAMAIGTQAGLFAVSIYVATHSLGLAVMALCIGLFNGWLSHKFRTLWPGAVIYVIWQLLFIG